MIHSMSGGVLARNESILFAKVEVEGAPHWYVAPFFVAAGDRVSVPFGGGLSEGTVIRTELCTRQTAPIPLNRARAIEKKL